MKRIISLLLSVALTLSLSACAGQRGGPTSTADPTPEQTVPTLAKSTPEATADAETGKVLVVYYSATNHTEAVAQTIADEMGGDLFEIAPTTPYTSDDLNWRDENSRVCKEHDDPALQTVELETTTPDNWADYDTVFIGYPIWWGNASWVVTSFVAANDFEGKTVIPFCTSASSSLGESDKNLAAMTDSGNWLPGRRFSGSASAGQVTEWVSSLELPASAPAGQEIAD